MHCCIHGDVDFDEGWVIITWSCVDDQTKRYDTSANKVQKVL